MLGLCFALMASWIEPLTDDMRFTVLDVGQGQCILLKNKDRHYMIDCGGDYEEGVADLAAQTLLSQGITELDGMILTHYDKDHAGSAEYLLSRIPAKQLYLPDIAEDSPVREQLVQNYGTKVRWLGTEETVTLDEGQILLFTGDTVANFHKLIKMHLLLGPGIGVGHGGGGGAHPGGINKGKQRIVPHLT